MFLFEENSAEAITFHQNNLICDLLCHDALTTADLYEESCYMEETATDEEEKSSAKEDKKSLGSRIVDTIHKILEKLKSIITGFKQAFISDKKRLTADEYMGSETAQVQIEYDLAKLQEAIDEEYLESRKFVQKLSKITPFTAQQCAEFCDKMEKKIHDNKEKILPVGKAMVNTAQIAAMKKKIAENVFHADKWSAIIEENVDKYNAHMTAQAGGLSAEEGMSLRKELRKAKKDKDHKKALELQERIKNNGKVVDPKTLKGISRASATLTKLVNGWKYHYDRLVVKPVNAAKDVSVTARKESQREIKKAARKNK